jgi:hypothetical protein
MAAMNIRMFLMVTLEVQATNGAVQPAAGALRQRFLGVPKKTTLGTCYHPMA